MKYAVMIGFVLMVVAQWYAPLSLVFSAEETIDTGNEYRFKTEPVDPYDPIRGKYITLAFNASMYNPVDTNEMVFVGAQDIYAFLEQDDEGFARVVTLSSMVPDNGLDYMKVEIESAYWNGTTPVIIVKFPFDRFYMEESKASEAERIYWQSRFDTTRVAYAKVKVHNGDAKLVDVMVNDSSIVDIVRRVNAKEER